MASTNSGDSLKEYVEKIIALTTTCLEDIIKLLNERPENLYNLPTGKVQIFEMFRDNFRDAVDVNYIIKCDKCRKCTKIEMKHKQGSKCCHCDALLQFA